MSDKTLSFNLIDEPWVRVRMLDGDLIELSLFEVFKRAPSIERLANDLPTQDFAILRVLLAVLQRSIINRLNDYEYASDAWGDLWDAGELPIKEIEAYLDMWHHRFDLLDSEQPFMQVAHMRAANGTISELKKIVADVPDGNPLFSLRAFSGLDTLKWSEAARWLIHVHAFDTSGIKTGVAGDDAVKGGKSYPIGTGWDGNLGGVFIEGNSLAETLLLNLVLCNNCQSVEDDTCLLEVDIPTWEQPQKVPGDQMCAPKGYADLYTWQSRRVLLFTDSDEVTGVLLTNGDKLDAYNKAHIEPMTSWRRSPNQEKKLGLAPVYLPRLHSAARAIWRGLTSLLPQMMDEGDQDSMPPGVMRWAGYLSSVNGGSRLPKDYAIRIHTVGLAYGTQNSVITELVDDEMLMHAFLISKEGEEAASMVRRCMMNTEDAVDRALGPFAKRLRLAAGDDTSRSSGVSELAKSEAYFELDGPFRTWLVGIGSLTDLAQAEELWNRQANGILRRLAQELAEEAGADAIVGRKARVGKSEEWVSTGKAERQFRCWLDKTLPYDRTENKQAEKEG